MRHFAVSADHSLSEYACADAHARCGKDAFHDTWYAVMARYGCSKNASTPEQAIRNMLLEHGCTNVRITEVE